MIFKIILIFILINNIYAGTVIFHSKNGEDISYKIESEDEFKILLKKLDINKDHNVYNLLKSEHENFVFEVSESSYLTGIEFGNIMRDLAESSYKSGDLFGGWLRKIFNELLYVIRSKL